VVTGANVGVGLETARGLAREGLGVVMGSRDREKGEAAVADVRRSTGNERVELLVIDLASLASVRRAAAELHARHGRIDVLVNNAGVIMNERRTTEDGFEATFGVNHLGHFLFTCSLLDMLEAGAPSRIVNVSSAVHARSGGLDFDDLMRERRPYAAFAAYMDSKLANVLFTRELARRYADRGVVAHALHPGVVGTRFGGDGDMGKLWSIYYAIGTPFMLSPAKGARTSLHVALSKEAGETNGLYWAKSKVAKTSRAAQDDEAARRLWDVSEKLVGPCEAAGS
jgi:NAD(P)-dependent dehydrogenase (short-subunit alcohol dehydrogenase family)